MGGQVALFCAYLVESGLKSTTVKSYVSAIKNILVTDGYPWDQSRLLLDTITKACKLISDRVYHRRPICKPLLEQILFEVERVFNNQYFLEMLFKTIFSLGYYGLLRVSEMASEDGQFQLDHTLKAADVHVGQNKAKILLVLHTSKTHGKESTPQKIKISGVDCDENQGFTSTLFCPFVMVREYMSIRGSYDTEIEHFFCFFDKTPVKPGQICKVLKTCLNNLGLDQSMYDLHSFRSAHASDIIKQGYSVEQVKIFGRWRSNAVYRYIKG